jgi:hypothetical protein
MPTYTLTKKLYNVSAKCAITDGSHTTKTVDFGDADAMSLNFTFNAALVDYNKSIILRLGENEYTPAFPLLDTAFTVPGFMVRSARTFYFQIIAVKGLNVIKSDWKAVVVAAPITTGGYLTATSLEKLSDFKDAEDVRTGYTGSVGYVGSVGVGYAGSQGDIGYSGSQGDLGYSGSQGDLGYTGSQGATGYTGSGA